MNFRPDTMHVAYNFKDGDSSGFGDVTIINIDKKLRTPEDISNLKAKIITECFDNRKATIVILSWMYMP